MIQYFLVCFSWRAVLYNNHTVIFHQFQLQGIAIAKYTTPVGIPDGKAYFETIVPEGHPAPTSAEVQWTYGTYGPYGY